MDVEDSNSILVDDFNNDKKKDVLLLGNLYGSELEDPEEESSDLYLYRLAEEKAVIAMPGGGFDGPEWTIRFSLANSYSEDFEKISILINDILDEYHDVYQNK